MNFKEYIPSILSENEWSREIVTKEIYEEIGQYVDIEQSMIILHDDLIEEQIIAKRYEAIQWLLEATCIFIIFIAMLIVTAQLSKKKVFDQMIYRLIHGCGLLLCIGSIIIPTITHDKTEVITLIGGFGYDIVIDLLKLGGGIIFILVGYILRRGQFLQEEYDTVL